MFSDNKKTKSKTTDLSNQQNRISQGTIITGTVTSKGGFRIDGEIEGTLTTPNRVVIGKSGVLKGNLICDDADIEGRVEGKVTISNLLSLKSAAVIEGEVTVGRLAIEPGATFNATCEMKSSVKTLAKDDSKKGERSA